MDDSLPMPGHPVDGPGAAAADPAAFDAFVTLRAEYLVRLARGLLADPHLAEDVVQEVLVNAYRHWGRVTSREHPDAYVRRMLVNASLSFRRRAAARRELAAGHLGRDEKAGPDAAAQVDDREAFMPLLRRLPSKQRAALVLRYYEDLPDEEIARAMGISLGGVRSNVFRGLASLRRMLDEGDAPASAADAGRSTTGTTTGREQER